MNTARAPTAMMEKTDIAKTETQKTMTSSVLLGSAAVFLSALGSVLAVFAWGVATKESRAKDEALEKYKTESKVAIAEADERASNARERADKAARELLEFQQLVREERTIDIARAIEILKSSPIKGDLHLTWLVGSVDATKIGNALVRIIEDTNNPTGWTLRGYSANDGTSVSPGVTIETYGDIEFATTDWHKLDGAVQAMHRLFAEAVKGNPRVETRVMKMRSGSSEAQLNVTIGPRF